MTSIDLLAAHGEEIEKEGIENYLEAVAEALEAEYMEAFLIIPEGSKELEMAHKVGNLSIQIQK